jgi:hypothetical protein
MATEQSSIDFSVAHPARVYDYWLGGKDNYQADREAAAQMIEVLPNILPGVRANRAFLRRAVQYLALPLGTASISRDTTWCGPSASGMYCRISNAMTATGWLKSRVLAASRKMVAVSRASASM